MNDKKVVIVIPVHSPNPSQQELIALAQCYKVLSQYAIYVLHPQGMNLDAYKKVKPDMDSLHINPSWLASIENYNRLKYSMYFYSLFSKYEFLLTYELDAFVFRDDLKMWCARNADYIGAPWLVGWNCPTLPLKFSGVGNSGFSLRNIKTCRRILNRILLLKRLRSLYQFIQANKILTYKGFLKHSSLYKLFKIKTFRYFDYILTDQQTNEDLFWAVWVAKTFKDFQVASIQESYQFSFEVKPGELYKLNDNKLPFGCHAWLKYDPDFWRPFIKW